MSGTEIMQTHHGVVMSSQFTKYNRWDAKFHMCVKEHEAHIDNLEIDYEGREQELVETLQAMPWEVKKCLVPLQTGQSPLSEEIADRLIASYPYVSGGLIHEYVNSVVVSHDHKVEEIRRVQSQIVFLTNEIWPACKYSQIFDEHKKPEHKK